MVTRKGQTAELASLTDDELIGLIVAARQEAKRRGLAAEAEAWARAIVEGEKDRSAREAAEAAARRLAEEEVRRVAREAAEKVRRDAEEKRRREEGAAEAERRRQEAEKQARHWALRKALVLALDPLLPGEFRVSIWERDGDRRVYIDQEGKRNGFKVSYFETGNHRHPPKSLEISGLRCDPPPGAGERAALRAVLEQFAGDWTNCTVDSAEARRADADPAPFLDQYLRHLPADLADAARKEAAGE